MPLMTDTVFTIAEIGINHGGSLPMAKEMVRLAKLSGADMAKFQHYRPEEILGNSPHLAEAKRCQLSKDQHEAVKDECDRVGIEWGVSLFHQEDVAWTESLGMRRYKVASRAALNQDLLYRINKTGKPVILSTGLLDRVRLEQAMAILLSCEVTLLYCVCEYPTKAESISFANMQDLREYGEVGFSSHCPSPIPTLCAVAQEASCVENHVTLDRTLPGCDMPSSLTFDEYATLVSQIRLMEKIRG